MKKYVITRPGDRNDLQPVAVTVMDGEKLLYLLSPTRSLKICNHSPTGFEFGYAGSGPAQLALAILLDFTSDEELAQQLHQKFKFEFITTLRHPGGVLDGWTIHRWIRQEQQENQQQNDETQS